MALLSKLFGGRADPLDSQAERLVSSCAILATASFVPIIDQFTFLRTCKPEDWDSGIGTWASAIAIPRRQFPDGSCSNGLTVGSSNGSKCRVFRVRMVSP